MKNFWKWSQERNKPLEVTDTEGDPWNIAFLFMWNMLICHFISILMSFFFTFYFQIILDLEKSCKTVEEVPVYPSLSIP